MKRLIWVVLGLVLLVWVGMTHRDQGPPPASDPAPVTAEAVQPDIPAAVLTQPVEETATHEAGHVAALRAFGIPVWTVYVNNYGGGETRYPARQDPYAQAVVDVAGQEAEIVWDMEHLGYTREVALAKTERAAGGDLIDLQDDAARAGITEAEARDRARRIVRDHQPDINATARQVIDAGGYLTLGREPD